MHLENFLEITQAADGHAISISKASVFQNLHTDITRRNSHSEPEAISPGLYQITFTANWTCLEVVAVESSKPGVNPPVLPSPLNT